MPASRLSDGQRAEMVEKFRQGVATVVLANTYDCSPNTVSRLVKAAMDGAEYERLKRQRQRRAEAGAGAVPEPRTLAIRMLRSAPPALLAVPMTGILNFSTCLALLRVRAGPP